MLERWYRPIRVKMTMRRFGTLPRHPAYRYEYRDGHAWLTPRPKSYGALLDLEQRPAPVTIETRPEVRFRAFAAADWDAAARPFAAAFRDVPPFSALPGRLAERAARDALDRTRTGGDGPVIEPACFAAETVGDDPHLVGAALVTLMPEEDPDDFPTGIWREPPPPDWLERGLGRPHLTWIFVAPLLARHGLGSALLASVAEALRDLGYRDLASTFLLGNWSSALWHWRNGFRLLPCPGSPRSWRRRSE